MRTTFLLKQTAALLPLAALLLAGTGKAMAQDNPQTDTNWKDQLSSVSVGISGSQPEATDVTLTLPTDADTDTTYTVKTAIGLAWIAKVTNEKLVKQEGNADTDNYPPAPGFEGCTVKLDKLSNGTPQESTPVNELDLSAHYWEPIGTRYYQTQDNCYFYGTFDGNHKLITGLKIKVENTQSSSAWYENYAYVGLFGYLSGAHISNLGIKVDAAGIEGNSKNGDSYVAALAGSSQDNSVIENCFVIGESGASVKSTGNNSGTKYVGGLVGVATGTIRNCYTSIDVSAQYGKPRAGGIAGYCQSGSVVSNVFATGKVTTSNGTNKDYVGGIASRIDIGSITNALALNKDGITGGTTGSEHGAGRITGYMDKKATISSCFASTKIRINSKVKGAGESEYGIFFDGTDTDLSQLFPTTGNDAVWEANGDGNLPKLKGFTNQSPIKISDYLDAPIDLASTSGSLNLEYSDDNGWQYQKDSGSKISFSGRIKRTGASALTADLTVSSTGTDAVLTFADGTSFIATTDNSNNANNKDALTISSGSVTLVSEGTAKIYTTALSGKNAIVVSDGATCIVDATNRFHIFGDITNSGTLKGLMQWKWQTAPSNITVGWEGGSTIILAAGSHLTALATNPGGKDITVQVGDNFLKGKKNGQGTDYVSTFNYDDDDKTFLYYSEMTAAADKGTKDNPYIVNFASLSEANGGTNGYTYTAATTQAPATVTLNTEGKYYNLQGEFPSTQPSNNTLPGCLLTFTSGSSNNNTYHLTAASGCVADTLLIPTGVACTLEGNNELKATSAWVKGGELTLNAPLTLEKTVAKSIAASSPKNENSCLYISDNGNVVANSTLKATATSENTNKTHAIYIGSQTGGNGSLQINSGGKVYGYGNQYGCYVLGASTLTINGGILRLASSGTQALFTPEGHSHPTLCWGFVKAPNETITVKKGSDEAFSFSLADFGTPFSEANSFSANVEANTDYTLWKGDKQLCGTTKEELTKTFRTENGRTDYSQVGIAMEGNHSSDKITITGDGKYKVGESGNEQEFGNTLSDVSIKELEVNPVNPDGKNYTKIVFNNVTVSKKLTISGSKAASIDLYGINNINAITVENGKQLMLYGEGSIQKGSSDTSLPTVTNSGIFNDYTGTFSSVQIPIDGTDHTLTMSISGTGEVEQGETTVLTASSSLSQTKSASYSNSTSEYQWQKWDNSNNSWSIINVTSSAYTGGPGKYRCRMTSTVTITGIGSGQTVTTTLYTPPFEVTEKSAPGGNEPDDPIVPAPEPVYYTVTLPAVEGATTDPAAGSYEVEAWDTFRFYLTLDAGYDQSVPVVTTSRGETLTPRMSDGAYLVKYVRTDTDIRIDGIVRNSPVANETVDAPAATLRRTGSLLQITSPCAADIRIYSFSGALLDAARLAAPGTITLPAPREACIVTVGNRRFKLAP